MLYYSTNICDPNWNETMGRGKRWIGVNRIFQEDIRSENWNFFNKWYSFHIKWYICDKNTSLIKQTYEKYEY